MDETRWVDDFAAAWAREYPDAEDTSGLVLISLLARLSLQIEGFQAAVLRPLDLNPSDYAVLAALRRAGPPYRMAPNELYTLLERSSGGMTKMLKRLESLGLVERVEDPDDKRSKLVHLTPAGIAREGEAFEAFLASTHALLRSTSAKELEQIDEALRRLVVIIETAGH